MDSMYRECSSAPDSTNLEVPTSIIYITYLLPTKGISTYYY